MNKHGQRRKETCPCTANLTFLVQNYIFLSIIPQIYSDYCGFLTPKVQKKRAMAPGKPHPAPHSAKRTSASSKLFSAGPGTRKQSSRFRETGRKAKSRPEGCATTSHSQKVCNYTENTNENA